MPRLRSNNRLVWRCALALLPATMVMSLAMGGEPEAPSETGHAAPLELFRKEIRPVLQAQCLNCHGGPFRKSGFDLSTRAALLRGGDSGPAIVEGHPEASLLYQLITHEKEPVMPRKADKLPEAVIGQVAAWIKAGAPYDGPITAETVVVSATTRPVAAGADHWAFKPPQRLVPPSVSNPDWIRNPIDAFVLARLDKEKLKPSPQADRTTLIRRLFLDIIGLPPKPDEVDAFVKDQSPDAYEKLVDRLLASPHYGERWGRIWLDLARYADSDGYEKDLARPYAWRWRDWVIDAINKDLPFDQFTIEQIAGDLLPNATLEQKVATGFHRNTLTNREGGVDPEEFRCKAVVDRTNTTGAVWMGLTVGCAECHSHKYDPISQREYYGLYAFFNNADEKDIPAPLPKDKEGYEQARQMFEAETAKLKADLTRYQEEKLPARQEAWEKEQSAPATPWTVLEPTLASSSAGATLAVQKDKSILVSDQSPEADTYVVAARTSLAGITAIQLEVLSDPSLPSDGPGRVAHGNFVLSEFRAFASMPGAPAEQQPIRFTRAAADFSQENWNVSAAIDNDAKTGWAIMPQMGRDHRAVFETGPEAALGDAGGTTLVFVLDQQYGDEHTIGRFRLSATTATRPVPVDKLPLGIARILALAPEKRNRDQQAKLTGYYRSIDPRWNSLKAAIDKHMKKPPPTPLAQVMVEASKPRETHVHTRGDFLRPGEKVDPTTLAVLPPLKAGGAEPTRLDLAHWLVDPANPLTARVTVNRMWQQLFGHGIVATASDFGTRGDPPTHPELLDWLATEFIQRGWRQKEMIKLIVSSATYRQASKVGPGLLDKDPKNELLARQSRLRLEAEVVRDASLAVCGLLNDSIGGPSIRPPLPADLAALGYADSVRWVESPGTEKYRRGMYIFFQRTVPYPMLLTFDSPDGIISCTRRERSNTPLQSLTLLNDPVFFECAQSLARQAIDAKDELETGLRRLFRDCLARNPDEAEAQRLAAFWEEMDTLCKHDALAARNMVGGMATQVGPEELPEAAAWVATARTILNLDEFVTRE